jgi:hypothetical protein
MFIMHTLSDHVALRTTTEGKIVESCTPCRADIKSPFTIRFGFYLTAHIPDQTPGLGPDHVRLLKRGFRAGAGLDDAGCDVA